MGRQPGRNDKRKCPCRQELSGISHVDHYRIAPSMRIALSADHAGYLLKDELAARLAGEGYEILDLGTHSSAPVDYPDSAEAVARCITAREADRGIIVCGSG